MAKKVYLDQLKPGMIVAKDVFTEMTGLIVTENSVLTERGIARLKACSVSSVLIMEELKENAEARTALQQARDSERFKEFEQSFQTSLKETKKMLNDIVMKNGEINYEETSQIIDSIIKKGSNGIDIFNMLHCMRDLDDLTYTHCVNVGVICRVFGEWLKLPEEEIKILEAAGLFHDIGKLLVPPEILNKKDKLFPAEFAIIKKHVEFGYDGIKEKKLDERIKNAVLNHHEKCDGSGYPKGLTGNQLEDFTKIVTIADVYDAMTSNRTYRERICPFAVISDFEQNGFQKYDPQFLLPILNMLVQSYIGSNVELSDGSIGEVIMINQHSLSKPIVKVGDEYMDLSKGKNITIKSIV